MESTHTQENVIFLEAEDQVFHISGNKPQLMFGTNETQSRKKAQILGFLDW